MPSIPQGIIDSIATPAIATLQQVLDTNGPFGPGSHTFTTFHTTGGFLLPPGDYSILGVYGVLCVVNGAIPAGAGYRIGWRGPGGTVTEDESNYQQRIAQLVVQHTLPTTGAHVTTTAEDMYTLSKLMLWQGLID